MNNNFKETDLFLPIKNFFEKNNYKVQGEIKNCDIICIKNDDIIAIEIKKSFNLKVLYQAMDRKVFSNYVYIAISRPKNFRKKEVKHMIKILKSLNIGLITVALDSPIKTVDIILKPDFKKIYKNSKKKKIILNEFENRNLSYNLGGSSSKNDFILTSYREKCIFIVCILKILKKASPKQISSLTNINNVGNILRNNHFSYFKKIERGIYTLSNQGLNIFSDENFKDAINYYNKEAKKICLK